MAVARGTHHCLRGNITAGPRSVLNNELLTKAF